LSTDLQVVSELGAVKLWIRFVHSLAKHILLLNN